MRRIGILSGSKNDLDQCIDGNAYLLKMVEQGLAEVYAVDPASIHRRTMTVISILTEYARMPAEKRIHFLITIAGWANHLSGGSDSFLRFNLQDSGIVVLAVGAEDPKDPKHTQAAVTSTSEVPGIQAIWADNDGSPLVGAKGYLWACKFAVEGELPKVYAKDPPSYKRLTLQEAHDEGLGIRAEKILKAKKGE